MTKFSVRTKSVNLNNHLRCLKMAEFLKLFRKEKRGGSPGRENGSPFSFRPIPPLNPHGSASAVGIKILFLLES